MFHCLPFSSRARVEAHQKLIVQAFYILPHILDTSMVKLTIRRDSLGLARADLNIAPNETAEL
jgi:hypothetical protein